MAEISISSRWRKRLPIVDLALDADLRDIFNVSKRQESCAVQRSEFLHQHRKAVIDKVAYWTGVQRPLIKKLIDTIEKRDWRTGLARRHRNAKRSIYAEITAYATALAMNYVTRGKFIQP